MRDSSATGTCSIKKSFLKQLFLSSNYFFPPSMKSLRAEGTLTFRSRLMVVAVIALSAFLLFGYLYKAQIGRHVKTVKSRFLKVNMCFTQEVLMGDVFRLSSKYFRRWGKHLFFCRKGSYFCFFFPMVPPDIFKVAPHPELKRTRGPS